VAAGACFRVLRCLAVALPVCAAAQAQQNPAARLAHDLTPLIGHWNGAHLEQRSSCASVGNNGFHGTYAEYIVRIDPGSTLVVDEIAITGLTCSFVGTFHEENGRTLWSGNHSCSDGRAGPFESLSIFAANTLMSMHLSIHLTGNESCAIDAILSGARF
jgi:hypothetical protein